MKAETLQLTADQVFSALSGYLGSAYVDQFNKFGRTFQIYVQSDSQLPVADGRRPQAESSQQAGEMIPLGTLMTITPRPVLP